MRFGFVHRLMTNALAALGVLALVSSGQFSTLVSVIVLAGLVLALCVRETWQRHPHFRHVDTIALLIIVAVQITRFVLGTSPLDVIIEFAAALQVVRLATRRGAAHDQQVIVLSLLHLIAGTVLGGGLGYGICFALVLIVAPAALVLSHLRREVEGNYRQGARDRTGLPVDVPRILRSRRVVGRTFLVTMCMLSVPIFLFTAVLFVFFPRVGLSLLLVDNQNGERMIEFTDKVDLGSVGKLRENPKVVLRVTLDNLPDPPPEHVALHLRGSALDRYDGRAWSRTDDARKPDVAGDSMVLVDPPRVPTPESQRLFIELEPIEPPVLFLPPDAAGFRLRNQGVMLNAQQPFALRGPEGEFRYHTDDRGVSYEVFRSATGRPAFSKIEDRERYLQLPKDLSPKVRELALEWTAGATTTHEKARRIEQYLKENYGYDLNTQSTRADSPLEDFLFDSRAGHCEFFSTAMAIMLRTIGIPTRNITGFGAGTYNKYGEFYAVRHSDAHSWVEVYVEGQGWVTFDPTPSAGALPAPRSGPWAAFIDFVEATSDRWRKHVVQYDLEQQYGLLRRFTNKEPSNAEEKSQSTFRVVVAAVAIALMIVLGVVYLIRKRRRPVTRPREQLSRNRHIAKATSIYESLEAALSAKGVHRSPGTPPLRHAENLLASSHPLAHEVHEITQVYLSIRFGGMELTEDTSMELERRVRSIRTREIKAEA